MAALVASYKGLNPKGGPKGVGDAVNQSVIIAFMLLFVINFVITADLLHGRPAEGGLMAKPSRCRARCGGDARSLRRRSTRALTGLEDAGEQLSFYLRALGLVLADARRPTSGRSSG